MGEFCSECSPKYNKCWCFKSDWKDDPIEVEVETPMVLTETNKTQQLTMTVMPKRQPPPGWVEFRRCVTKKNKYPIDKLMIKGIRSISTQEYDKM